MTTRATLDALADVTQVIRYHDGEIIHARLERGRLWGCLDADALPEAADALGVDLGVARSERWVARQYPEGPPAADWLDWTAIRDMAVLPPDVRDRLIQDCEADGLASPQELRRRVRLEKAARRAGGDDVLAPDPTTVATRVEYVRLRLEEELAVDFAPETIARIAALVERAVAEWERAGAATIDAVFGPVAEAVRP